MSNVGQVFNMTGVGADPASAAAAAVQAHQKAGDAHAALFEAKADRTLSNLTAPQTALYNLGAGARPNLLDNWYFAGGGSGWGVFPVNQRGLTSVGAGNTPFFDRWKIYSYESGMAELTEDGLSCNGRFDFGITLEHSRLPDIPNLPITISTLTSTGDLITHTAVLANSGQQETIFIQLSSAGTGTLRFIRNWNDSTSDLFFFNLLGYTGAPFVAAKLEVGTYQTLAYPNGTGKWRLFSQPDYRTELFKCQAYYCKSSKNNLSQLGGFIAAVQPGSTEWLNLSARFPVQMRKNKPTVTFTWLSKITGIQKNILNDSVTLVPGALSESGFNLIHVLGLALEPESLYLVQFEASAE